MSVQHVNRKGKTYYLHRGKTKTGKPKYFFSQKDDDNLCDTLPDGFEVHENIHGQVFCRCATKKLISDLEVDVVRQGLRACGKGDFTMVDVKGKDIIVYEGSQRRTAAVISELFPGFGFPPQLLTELSRRARYHEAFQFSLVDKDRRMFVASRWCSRGSNDGWIHLFDGPHTLPKLIETYGPHIGEESFFELM